MAVVAVVVVTVTVPLSFPISSMALERVYAAKCNAAMPARIMKEKIAKTTPKTRGRTLSPLLTAMYMPTANAAMARR